MSDQGNGIINYEAIHERAKNPGGGIEIMMKNRAHSVSEARHITLTNVSVRQARYNLQLAEQRQKEEDWQRKVNKDALEASQTPVYGIIPAAIEAATEQPVVAEAPVLLEQTPNTQTLNPADSLQRVYALHDQPKPDTHNFNLPL